MNKEILFQNKLYLGQWEGLKEESRDLLIKMLHNIQYLKIGDATDKNSYSEGLDWLLWQMEYLSIELQNMKELKEKYEKDEKIKQYRKEQHQHVDNELKKIFGE